MSVHLLSSQIVDQMGLLSANMHHFFV